jgi:hypothetical protein
MKNKNHFVFRAFRKLCGYVSLLLNIFYFYLYALPWLKLHGIFKGFFRISFGYQSILVDSKDVFIKIALSKKSTIKNEYLNYSRIKDTFPYLAPILPSYQMLDGWFMSAIICETMTKVESIEAPPLASYVQKRLGMTARIDRLLILKECPQIMAGLDVLAEEYDQKIVGKLREIAENFLLSAQYISGVAHGDFHSRNIMKDRYGNAKIIDLDCVRFKAVREFDFLYFALEQVWSFSGQDWMESLDNCFNGVRSDVFLCLESFGVKWSSGLGTAFFLDRLGQDTISYGLVYSRNKLKCLVDAALKNEMRIRL